MGIEKPILLDVPELLTSERLEMRAVKTGVGARINEAVRESHAELSPWMPWANPCPAPEDTEGWCRQAHSKFIARQEFNFHAYLKKTDTFVASVGMFAFNWSVVKFEIGYWIRTGLSGQGYMTEAVRAAMKLGFDFFRAQRIEVRCDDRNVKSARVAERLGMKLEAVLRHTDMTPDQKLRDTRIYAALCDGAS